jgi:O-antigen ligase
MRHFKIISYTFLLWIFLWAENQKAFGLQLGLAIKLPLIFFFAAHMIARGKISAVVLCGLAYACKYVFHSYDNFNDFMLDAIEMVKALTFPLVLSYLSSKNFSEKSLAGFCVDFSKSVILSTVPFLMGLKPFCNREFSLAKFGGAEAFRFSAAFEDVHDAATFLAVSLLVIAIGFKFYRERRSLLIYFLLGIYALYLTFTRTGYAMFILPIAALTLRFKVNKWVKMLPLLAVAAFAIVLVYQSSELFQRRLKGETSWDLKLIEQGRPKDFFEQAGSGRTLFWRTAVSNWWQSSAGVKILGLGRAESLRLMEKEIGHAYVAHNGFVDCLQTNGILGIFLFGMLFLKAYQLGNFIKKSPYYDTFFCLYLAYVVGQLFQGTLSTFAFLPFFCYLAIGLKFKDRQQLSPSLAHSSI